MKTLLTAGELRPDHDLVRVLPATLRPKRRNEKVVLAAPFFQYQHCTASRGLTTEESLMLAARLSADYLSESLYIEKLGMSYAAKMNLRSETLGEKVFYANMSAEEAHHYTSLGDLLGDDVMPARKQSFLLFLEDLIVNGDRPALMLLIQVVLEGWGLVHYSRLKHACPDEKLQRFFADILEDEARHHAMGVQQCNTVGYSPEELTGLGDVLHQIHASVQCGPVRELAALSQALGADLTSAELACFFEHTDVQKTIKANADYLCNCLRRTNVGRKILDGGFAKLRPWTTNERVRAYRGEA